MSKTASMVVLILTIMALLLAAAALIKAPALAQPDVDCATFPDQAAAQDYLNADKSDPSGLDADNDGTACDDFFASEATEDQSDSATKAITVRTGDASAEASASAPANSQYQYQYSAAAELPATGGSSLVAVGAGVLLIIGGLIARRIIH